MDIVTKLIEDLTRNVNPALVASITRLQGEMIQRIHSRGEATDGTSLGGYKSEAYKRKRQRAGRQVRRKDLEFTGGLRRSLVTFIGQSNAQLGFSNDTARLIANGQESQVGKEIYTASDQEINTSIDLMVDIILSQ